MSNNKVKVVGYAKKEFFNGGIEYRNFTPDLVGQQSTSGANTPLFTMGNFAITTNMDPKTSKDFISNGFSDFMSLNDLNLTLEKTQELLANNAKITLNLDKTNLKNYALFGSLSEFVRVSLENIITRWPASLYLVPIGVLPDGNMVNGFTFENYTYDELTEIAKFKVNTTFINNKFDINYLTNGSIVDTYNSSNDLRNITVNYESYVISHNGEDFPVIDFIGSSNLLNDYVHFTVKGNVFSDQPTNSKVNYHIMPNKVHQNTFFNQLKDFEGYLLSRRVSPKYTAEFKFPVKSDSGVILYVSKSVTWPVSDGYNIDFSTSEYVDYVSDLIEIASDNDLYSSDLMNRFLVTESISDFDTTPVHLDERHRDTSGQKMNKTLHIYGRQFDEINNFITGIAFANTVTYDKQNNTPDAYLKNLASVMGWDLISSVIENDLLSNYVKTAESDYSGESTGLTPVQADIELWRRIILNTPWIWKSKGARKSIEFLLRFIGAPQGLIQFNEYIYKADGPIDIDFFKEVLLLNGLDETISDYPIDADGFPRPLADTEDMYFQNKGLWYRETGGANSTIDILTGNNPHVGSYDGGFKYINQFKELIPNFVPVTVSSDTKTTKTLGLFINNDLGTYNETLTGTQISTVYINGVGGNGENLAECYTLTPIVIADPNPYKLTNNCGCPVDSTDNIISLCIDKKIQVIDNSVCSSKLISSSANTQNGRYVFSYYQYNSDGSVFMVNGQPKPYISDYSTTQCCEYIGGTPRLNEISENGVVIESGYYCDLVTTVVVVTAMNDIGNENITTSGGTSVSNVLVNDRIAGAQATTSNIILTQISSTNANITLNTSTGAVNVASGIAAGNYSLVYQICEIANPTNCSTATVSVPVKQLVKTIVATNDTGTPMSANTAGISVASVLANDTLDGVQANVYTVILTQISSTSPKVTLNTNNGSVNVASGLAAGNYTLVYKICEIGNPTNCATASVTVPITVLATTCFEYNGFYEYPDPIHPNGGSLTYVNANGSQTTINGIYMTENNVQIQAVSVNTPHPGVSVEACGTVAPVVCNRYQIAPYDDAYSVTYVDCSGVTRTKTGTCYSVICRADTFCARSIIRCSENYSIIDVC